MKLDYLVHLARLGARDIHPGCAGASAAMLEALAPAPGQCVLEIGCGTGASVARVAGCPGVRVVGFDFLPVMLTQARRRLARQSGDPRPALVRGRAGSLPFRTSSFDAVFCESVLGFQTNKELRQALREVTRVLRPGGRFLANEAVWKPEVDDRLAAALNRACQRDFGLPQATEQAWDAAAWCRELEAAGLVPQSCERLPATPRDDKPGLGTGAPDSFFHSLLTWVSPELLAERVRYARLLREYRPHSRNVEARLFVALRP